jgi:hypothetical protein
MCHRHRFLLMLPSVPYHCETLDQWYIVGRKNESGYAIFERDSRKLFRPLLRRMEALGTITETALTQLEEPHDP